MRAITLLRGQFTPDGTFGKWINPISLFECVTLERMPGGPHPCIPAGTYLCRLRYSNAHKDLDFGFGSGMVYGVEMVMGRDNIEIHPANFIWQLMGCIAPGKEVMLIENPADKKMYIGVSGSKATVKALMADLGGNPFELTIMEG